MSEPIKALRVHPRDNIIVALRDLASGDSITVEGTAHHLAENIPAKHKFAGRDLAVGEAVVMYGLTVGRAQAPIPQGRHVTTTNVCHAVRPAPWFTL